MKLSDEFDVEIFTMFLMVIGLVLVVVGFIGMAAIVIGFAFSVTPFLGFLSLLILGFIIGIVGSSLSD